MGAKVEYGDWGGYVKDGLFYPAHGWRFRCPGCGCSHYFQEGRWAFNNDLEKPTFSPSLLVRMGPWYEEHARAGQVDVCHSFVRDGKIEFLGDCTHALAGKTVALEDVKT